MILFITDHITLKEKEFKDSKSRTFVLLLKVYNYREHNDRLNYVRPNLIVRDRNISFS